MRRSKTEEAGFLRVSEEVGLPVSEVGKIVRSFFDCIAGDSGVLPFDTPNKIFSREAFEEKAKARQIPHIGRLGPVYSRYLKWRSNESKALEQKNRSLYRRGLTQDEIEDIAEAVLSGNAPPEIKKRRGSELYERVWMVGIDSKKMARQVIPRKDVQD